MKNIVFYVGDLQYNKNDYIVIDSNDKSLMVSKNIENKPYLINTKELNLREKDIKEIINGANNRIVFTFDKKPSYIKDVKDKVEVIDESEKAIDLIGILELILFEKDRSKVLDILNKQKSVAYNVILKWLYGCYAKLKPENLAILDEIDTMIFKANPCYINALFASIQSEKKPYNIFQFIGKYRFKKEEKE
ncbi:MAG TPA: hypothetical protein PKI46_01470 [Bacteroidales bacterium]|nr:hypothetical protein [Bacteroidales bacterium]